MIYLVYNVFLRCIARFERGKGENSYDRGKHTEQQNQLEKLYQR